MASGVSLWSAGPATSQSIRMLLYLGEGMMVGTLLYILIVIGIRARHLVTGGYITPTELLTFGVIGFVFLLIGVRNLWAVWTAGREGRQSWVYEEWMETRRWMWVFAVAIPITAVMVGLSVSLLTWGIVGGVALYLIAIFLLYIGMETR